MNNLKMQAEIFRAGDYPGFSASPELVQQIADGYNAELLRAPISVDHRDEGPAFGWVDRLWTTYGGRRLHAEFSDLDPSFVQQVAAGRFQTRSVEIYPKLTDTGKPYLRAVTFLGAGIPQVKGMGRPTFNFSEGASKDAGEPVTVDFADGANGASALWFSEPPGEEAKTPSEESEMDPKQALSEAQGALDKHASACKAAAQTVNKFSEVTGITLPETADVAAIGKAFSDLATKMGEQVTKAKKDAAKAMFDEALKANRIVLGVGDKAEKRTAALIEMAETQPDQFKALFGEDAPAITVPGERGGQSHRQAEMTEEEHEKYAETEAGRAIALATGGSTNGAKKE